MVRAKYFSIFLALLFCSVNVPVYGKTLEPKGPNVILIVVDTLGANHLGCYGYGKRETSPYIDGFSKTAVFFKNCRSQIHWTTPSHTSLFTSLYPSVFNFSIRKISQKIPSRIDDGYLMLAEIMRANGYRTAAFTGGGLVDKKYGFDQGFELYLDNEIRPGNIETIFNKYGIGWVKKQKRKFFLFLHCYEPHAPYDPPLPLKEKFVSEYTPVSELNDRYYRIGEDTEIGKKAEDWFRKNGDTNFLETVVALYDGEIRHVDSEIEKLFEEFRKTGLFDSSIVIFLSDHGEAFYEHECFSHSNLYDETLRVPLMIHLPGELGKYNGRAIEDVAGLVDIVPTVLDLCGIDYSKNIFQGRSLLNIIKHTEKTQDRYTFSERLPGWKTVATEKYKYMIKNYGLQNEKEELYDIINDPGELHNLLESGIPEGTTGKDYKNLRKALIRQVEKNNKLIDYMRPRIGMGRKVELDKESIDRLKSLGYIQ